MPHTQVGEDEPQPEETVEIAEERDATEERRAREGCKGRARAKEVRIQGRPRERNGDGQETDD